MRPVYRRAANGKLIKTGARAKLGTRQFGTASVKAEDVDFETAELAESRINEILPGVATAIIGAEDVLYKAMPAIGNVHTNIFIRLGGAVALAPLWVLFANSSFSPGETRPTAKDIEHVVSQQRPGIWSEILDYKESL